MKRKSYPSDLTDAQWAILAPLIPVAKSDGRPQYVNVREVINAIFYILCGGCTWHMMPHEFPAWKTVYHYFRFWRLSGVWQKMNQMLRERMRCRVGRESTLILEKIVGQFPRLLKVFADGGYEGKVFTQKVKDDHHLELEVVKRKQSEGFQVLPWRWIVERTLAWIVRHRRLTIDYEALPATSEAFIYVAMVRIMVRRLA